MNALQERMPVVEMSLVRGLAGDSQHLLRTREKMRTWTTRLLAVLRAITLEVDRRLVRADPAIGSGGAFCCTVR